MPVQAISLVTTQNLSSASDDYYQTIVINALLTMLKDKALDTHHDAVVEAIMSIFKTQGLRCVAFLPQVRILRASYGTADLSGLLDHSGIR